MLWEAKQYGKTCSFHMYSYITLRIIPTTALIPGTSLWASTTRTTAARVYNNSIYMTCTERFTCCFFGTTTAVTTAVVAVVVLTLTHRYNAVRGHGTGFNNLCSSVQYARNIMRLFLDETHARGAQIRYVTHTYVGFLERRVLVPEDVGHLAVLIQQ